MKILIGFHKLETGSSKVLYVILLNIVIFFILNSIACSNNLGILLYDSECVPQSFDDITMEATVRDFSKDHPDFENYGGGLSLDLVKEELGPDDKPVFNSTTGSNNGTKMITSEATFNQWYNTIPNVNYEFQKTITFSNNNEMLEYINPFFFPLSGSDGWGLEGNNNNFHFTTEIHLEFTYMGGEIFTFEGDDDLWLFIDRKLVVDLGGVHGVTVGTVELDNLDLEIGNNYTMDIFHAERHLDQSNFTIKTNVRRCITQIY